MSKTIIAICGKSCSGKSTAINMIKDMDKQLNIHIVKSYTTRKIRQHDPKDKDTHVFVSDEYYNLHKNKAICHYSSPNGYYSWVDENSFLDNKTNIYAIDPISYVSDLVPYCAKNNIKLNIIYVKTSFITRLVRYVKRNKSIKGFSLEKHLSEKHLEGVGYGTYVSYGS